MLLRLDSRRVGLFVAFCAPFALLWLGGGSHANADDSRATSDIVASLAGNDASPPGAAELLERVANARQKASALRAKGDEARAKVADGLAYKWALVARDVAAAEKRESETTATQLAAVDAGVQAQRERALLEEMVAQNGRLSAQIASAKASPRDGGAK